MAAQAVEVQQKSDVAHTFHAPVDPMISAIERLIMDPSIPIDRVKDAMAIKYEAEDRARAFAREDEDRQARKLYSAAMSKCQAELPVVIKNQDNSHTRSKYADLAAIENQAMPVIHKNGFAVSFQPDGYNANGELRILWEISHEDGHSRNGVGEIPVDGAGAKGGVNKTGTQAFGSTATYGRRYLLCMLFNISTGDDKDGNAPKQEVEFISDEQQMKIRELLEVTESDEKQFLSLGGISNLSDMAVNQFDNAMNILKQRLAKRGH